MRTSGEGNPALPWHVIREDSYGNRYRVGSYATRAEAQQVADRLGAGVGHDDGIGGAAAGPHEGASGAGRTRQDSYLVESVGRGSGAHG